MDHRRGQVTTGLTERADEEFAIESPKERIGLEALGLAQAFATQIAQVGGGQPAVETIDEVDAYDGDGLRSRSGPTDRSMV